MVERIMTDYHGAFAHGFDESRGIEEPEPVRRVAKKAATASWKSLAAEDLEGTNPSLPIGKCFWPLSRQEKRDIERLVADKEMHRLATRLRSRDDNEEVKLIDAAYWVKGCSSLGRSRYAVLLHMDGNKEDYCLVDLKEAVKASAPHARARKCLLTRQNALSKEHAICRLIWATGCLRESWTEIPCSSAS